MLGASGRTGPRPPPTSNVDVLERQLQGGDVEVRESERRQLRELTYLPGYLEVLGTALLRYRRCGDFRR